MGSSCGRGGLGGWRERVAGRGELGQLTAPHRARRPGITYFVVPSQTTVNGPKLQVDSHA
ncbi:hypothetical protein GCM10010470_43160 [Saccharopolyspora taberi]|uniref:Uncharacterized protein n=1 Tax=Saccharopolyspora taberi TaxID=60895 RepID=A0ABN3VGL3_9PSEU